MRETVIDRKRKRKHDYHFKSFSEPDDSSDNEKVGQTLGKKEKRRHKKQPRLQKELHVDPRNSHYTLVLDKGVQFQEVHTRYLDLNDIHFRKSCIHEENMKPLQAFYYLLQALPPLAIELLKRQSFLEESGISKNEFKVEWDIYRGYRTTGKYRIPGKLLDDIRYWDVIIPKDLSKALYSLSKGFPEALGRLKEFGIITRDLETVVHSTDSVEEFTGMTLDEMGDNYEAYREFTNDRGNRSYGHATLLRTSDLRRSKHIFNRVEEQRKSDKRKLKNKKPYSRRHGCQMSPVSQREPPDKFRARKDKSNKKLKKREDKPIEPYEFTISNLHYLKRACIYINQNRAKCQAFKVRNIRITDPVNIILRYVQSRTDKKSGNQVLDIDEILRGENPVVNYRLSKWEAENNLEIASISLMLRGVFYQKKDESNGDGSDHRELVRLGNFVPIVVKRQNERHEIHYITSLKELTVAVRRILRGRMEPENVRTVDLRTQTILEYARYLRDSGDGNVDPSKLACTTEISNPRGLSYVLAARNLTHRHPTFAYPDFYHSEGKDNAQPPRDLTQIRKLGLRYCPAYVK